MPALSGWIFANRVLLDPVAWVAPSRQVLAWSVLLFGLGFGGWTFFRPAARRFTPVFAVVLVVFFVRLCVLDIVRVEGPSMEPALQDGDYVLLEKMSSGLHLPPLDFPLTALGNRSSYGPPGSNFPALIPITGWRLPVRGAIVVFDYADAGRTGRTYIKRVIGRAGDAFRFSEGRLVIERDGAVVSDDVADAFPRASAPVVDPPHVLKYLDSAFAYTALNGIGRSGSVPLGGLLVLGDNRTESRDSRSLGFIPLALVQGRVLLRF